MNRSSESALLLKTNTWGQPACFQSHTLRNDQQPCLDDLPKGGQHKPYIGRRRDSGHLKGRNSRTARATV